jgi:outer membrane protein assembly factor BamD (BamD/ComL family)
VRAAAPRDDDAELRREIAQLGRIKALIDRDPNAAARLATEGDREFHRGMLRQERDALAIFALWNAGRHAEAERRAQAFIARYPDSPSRERIERLLRGEQE